MFERKVKWQFVMPLSFTDKEHTTIDLYAFSQDLVRSLR
jgi:hypothetical protein